MQRIIFIALLVVGVVLLVFAFQSSDSLEGQMREAVGASPADQTVWYMVGGVALTIIGAGGLLVGARQKS